MCYVYGIPKSGRDKTGDEMLNNFRNSLHSDRHRIIILEKNRELIESCWQSKLGP